MSIVALFERGGALLWRVPIARLLWLDAELRHLPLLTVLNVNGSANVRPICVQG